MRKEKSYLVTFAKGQTEEVTYPVTATSKKSAKEEFCQMYIGRTDSTLVNLVNAVLVEDEEEE